MNIPDTAIMSVISVLAGYAAWQMKRVSDSYFEHVAKQTPLIEAILREQKIHDEMAGEAHKEAAMAHRAAAKESASAADATRRTCESLGEMTKLLVALNKASGNGTR